MQNRIRYVYGTSFIFNLALGITAYVNSSFMEKFIAPEFVGVLYSIAAIITLLLLSELPKFLNRFGNKKSSCCFILLNMLCLLMLSFGSSRILVLGAFILYLISNSLIIFSVDIFFEHFSKKAAMGHTRGFFLTMLNLGWFLSPAIAVTILQNGFSLLYMTALSCVFMALVLIIFGLNTFKDIVYKKASIRETLAHIRAYRPLSSVITANFILQFFYAWMVIYSPLYLHQLGFDWSNIGIIFTVMLSSFVILQYPLGRFADRIASEKELLALGMFIAGASTIAIAFTTTRSIVVWALLFFMTRVGASMTEVMSEVHFFKEAKEAEPGVLSMFRNMVPLAYSIAPLIGTAILAFFNFQILFILLGALMLYGMHYAFRLENNTTLWKKSHIR